HLFHLVDFIAFIALTNTIALLCKPPGASLIAIISIVVRSFVLR
ncbi:hypothetical protein SCUP515_13367, partial [Seiridium cupressi]